MCADFGAGGRSRRRAHAVDVAVAADPDVVDAHGGRRARAGLGRAPCSPSPSTGRLRGADLRDARLAFSSASSACGRILREQRREVDAADLARRLRRSSLIHDLPAGEHDREQRRAGGRCRCRRGRRRSCSRSAPCREVQVQLALVVRRVERARARDDDRLARCVDGRGAPRAHRSRRPRSSWRRPAPSSFADDGARGRRRRGLLAAAARCGAERQHEQSEHDRSPPRISTSAPRGSHFVNRTGFVESSGPPSLQRTIEWCRKFSSSRVG